MLAEARVLYNWLFYWLFLVVLLVGLLVVLILLVVLLVVYWLFYWLFSWLLYLLYYWLFYWLCATGYSVPVNPANIFQSYFATEVDEVVHLHSLKGTMPHEVRDEIANLPSYLAISSAGVSD